MDHRLNSPSQLDARSNLVWRVRQAAPSIYGRCAKQQQLVYEPGQNAGDVATFPSWLVSTAESSKPTDANGAWTLFRKLKVPAPAASTPSQQGSKLARG